MRPPLLCFALPALLLSFVSSALLAQISPVAKPGSYAGESYVIERSDALFAMKADGTGYRQSTVAIRVQSDAALKQVSVVTVPFASASEHVEFHYVRARHADGTVTETATSEAIEQAEEVTRAAPFYSDLKQMQLPVKSLKIGDTLEWEARIVRTRAEAPGHFWGEDNLITEGSVALEQSIELRVPAKNTVTVWTNPKLGVKPTESVVGEEKIYRWSSTQLKPTVGAAAEAEKKLKKTRLLTADEQMDADLGQLPSVAWSTFKSWEEVGAWYRGLEGERNKPDAETAAKAQELAAGKTTPEEKARAVYAYVSAQIRYIGVAFGIGRYQPHEAVDVLHNQYGDCKDKATLLSAMLSAVGVSSDAVLIGDNVRLNEAVPSPGAFNHLITRAKVGPEEVWLDATAEIAPYRTLLPGLRDKEALVVPETGAAALMRTPAGVPFTPSQTWTAVGTLDTEGTSESHIVITLRGDEELLLRMVMRQIAPGQYDELVQRFVQGMGYSGTTSHAELSRAEDNAVPFRMAFDYHREKNGDWDNLRIVPQLAPSGLVSFTEKDPPVSTIDLGLPRTVTSTAEMKLPAGWSAELPEAVHANSPYGTYETTYRFANGTLYTQRKLVILQQKVPASEWKTYQKWVDAVYAGELYIPLHRVGGDKVSNSHSNASDSGEWMTAAEQAWKQKDQKTLESLLKKERSANPKARRLWAYYGALAELRGKWDEGITDNEKELEMYPDEFDRYEAILYFESRKNDKAAAMVTLRKWADADTTNAKPLLALSQALQAGGQTQQAVQTAEEAVHRSPEGSVDYENSRLVLGRLEIKAGEPEKARPILVGLLKSSETAGTLNDAAYELADAKLELPLADQGSRKALELLTAETGAWTLDEAPATMKSQTTLLLASWDTMGWILYREGKFKEAESYLVAARLGRPDAVVKEHMVKERAALPDSPDPEANKTDQELRTIPLGASGGKRGTAEYKLLLSHGKVERAEATEDGRIDGGEALLKSANLSRFFPAGSDAKLMRMGMLNCVAGKCELVLEP